MPRVDLDLESTIEQSPRVVQMSGIFDLPAAEKSRVSFHFDVPLEARPWQVGLVVGPSGAGKSSVARHLFGNALIDGYEWPHGKAIVDGFGTLGIRETAAALNSVGFSSPPNWVRPYSVLSNGERFRANLARALVDPSPLVAVDEFTSVVDRQAAQVGSHSVGKAVRAKPGKQFVAVTCHYDVLDWLQPDWVLEPHLGKFDWRSVQPRPRVNLEIVRCTHEAWRWFAPHHYLSADLHKAARCFAGLVDGQLAAFGGLAHFAHPRVRDIQSLSRLVVLPEFQGLGLGAFAFTEALGRICAAVGKRMSTHPSHPALVRTWAKSPLWYMVKAPALTTKSPKTTLKWLADTAATNRRVSHFHWRGGAFESAADNENARRMWS